MALVSSILLMAGITGLLSNCFSLFYSPIAQEFGYDNYTMSKITTIKTLSIALSSMFAPTLYKKLGFKKVVFVGVMFSGLTFALQSVYSNIYLFYINSCLFGLSLGLCYLLPTSLMIQNWYKEKTGFYLGVAMAASGLSAAFASGFFSTLVTNFGWRMSAALYGSLSIVIELINVVFFLKLKPENDEMPYGETNKSNNVVTTKSVGTALSFALSLYLVIVTSFTANSILQISLFVKQCGLPLMYTSLLSSLSMIANTISKIIVGILVDKIGTFQSMAITYFVCGISFIFFITGNINVIIICSFFAGFSMSLSAMVPSMVARELYPETYAKVVSAISSFGTVFGAVSATLIGYSADIFSSYGPVFCFTGVLCIIALIPLFFLKKNADLKTQ